MSISTREHDERWFRRLLHLAGVVITLLTVAGFYFVVYRPLSLQQAEHTARAEQLEMLTSHTETIQRQHTRLRQELASLTSIASAARGRLPNEPLDSEFLRDVRQIATNTGVEIQDHRFGTQQRLATHSQTEIRFECSGSYDSICRFLEQVEQIPRITKVAKLELESGDNSDVYPFQITFVLYYGVPSNDTNERRDGPSRNQV